MWIRGYMCLYVLRIMVQALRPVGLGWNRFWARRAV